MLFSYFVILSFIIIVALLICIPLLVILVSLITTFLSIQLSSIFSKNNINILAGIKLFVIAVSATIGICLGGIIVYLILRSFGFAFTTFIILYSIFIALIGCAMGFFFAFTINKGIVKPFFNFLIQRKQKST